MTDLVGLEYAALRETIRSRSNARPVMALAGISVWAAVLVCILIWLPNPIAATVPLLVLLTTFEVIRSMHLGVERIGRYLQAFFEESDEGEASRLAPPAWERSAMLFGPALPGAGVHPLFLPIFLLATLLNFLAVIFPAPIQLELIVLALPHAAFIVWLLYCDRGMRKQRGVELARYRELLLSKHDRKQ
ncbi:MAG TPA: hypothetical protein VNJ02_13160 [Vicinamibacterales bacterium]|nr:hypothetical protein [Vicinamibacterales bacterium]